jgi:hypothetical protein
VTTADDNDVVLVRHVTQAVSLRRKLTICVTKLPGEDCVGYL